LHIAIVASFPQNSSEAAVRLPQTAVRTAASSIVSGGSSNRQQRPQQTPEEVFKKKCRNAVFDALERRGVKPEVDKPFFVSCFKKLNDICKMYAKDAPKSAKNLSTSQWLNKVAEQNAEIATNLQLWPAHFAK